MRRGHHARRSVGEIHLPLHRRQALFQTISPALAFGHGPVQFVGQILRPGKLEGDDLGYAGQPRTVYFGNDLLDAAKTCGRIRNHQMVGLFNRADRPFFSARHLAFQQLADLGDTNVLEPENLRKHSFARSGLVDPHNRRHGSGTFQQADHAGNFALLDDGATGGFQNRNENGVNVVAVDPRRNHRDLALDVVGNDKLAARHFTDQLYKGRDADLVEAEVDECPSLTVVLPQRGRCQPQAKQKRGPGSHGFAIPLSDLSTKSSRFSTSSQDFTVSAILSTACLVDSPARKRRW